MRRRQRIPWVPGAAPERPPMPLEYREHLAQRLAETAMLDIDLARQHVLAVAIKPLPESRPHRKMLR
jgi:hypothetical protein